jgi:multisubunit Na+/H+ antiporter MnhB subunit
MNAWSDGVFDGLLALGLLLLAWLIVISANLFRAIMLFITFGLLMALCWARLAAPDLALAEAAIGAGITGALLLDVYRVVSGRERAGSSASPPPNPLLIVLIIGIIGGLSGALLSLPEPASALGDRVIAQLADSGVSHPVTAVLLNFRAYDTLLEVAALLLALVGLWIVNRHMPGTLEQLPLTVLDSSLLDTLVRLLVPLAVLIGGYLLWAGAHQPGGAFQAGSVLAGAGILLLLSDRLRPAWTTSWPLRLGLVLGLGVFTGVAIGVMLPGAALLEYRRTQAGLLILLIESALTLSIALILTLLVSGTAGLRRGRR